jgi:hypothetical protein
MATATATNAIAERINRLHSRIQARGRLNTREAAEIGRLLRRVKAQLPYGQFGNWITKNCRFTERQGQRYISLAKAIKKEPALCEMELSEAYLAAAMPRTMSEMMRRTSERSDDWLTPPAIIAELGSFDLDPCSPIVRPWDTAAKHLTIEDNGLKCEWSGRVWLNPPYGDMTGTWMQRLADHGDGIALTFARTETLWFDEQVWARADAILFIRGRLFFHRLDGTQADSAGTASCLVAYGHRNVKALRRCQRGKFLEM